MLRKGGADALTLRALADRLGVTPMALYNHIDNKGDLLAGVIDRLMGELPHLAGSREQLDPGDWQAWLREDACRTRTFLLVHRDLLRLLVTPPVVGPASLRSLELTARAFLRAGFSDANAALATTLYNNAVIAAVVWEAWRLEYAESLGDEACREGAYWQLDYLTLDRTAFPNLRSIAAELNDHTADELFERTLGSVIEVIASTLAPTARARPPRKP
jgi:AcrR family transcriptional regulator